MDWNSLKRWSAAPFRGGWLRRRPPRINLALQGGGSHGAFTWGVLDKLLEEGYRFEGISGASAGAMNSAALACGWQQGGADGARETLERLWRTVSDQSTLSPMRASPLEHLFHGWNRDYSPGFLFLSGLTQMASPYQFNPTGYNPLLGIVEKVIDFDALRRRGSPRLFIALTNVHSGRLELRRNDAITPQVLAASACLPLLFHAVQLDGAAYWDGGYTGNPALYPLIFECKSPDLLLIQLTPAQRDEVPRKVPEIMDRITEINFHSTVMRELQLLALLSKHHGLGRDLYLHRVDTRDATKHLGRASRVNTDWEFLSHLRDTGRDYAGEWLERYGRSVGRRSTAHFEDGA
ncbi:MAG: patatin-like phospholipase family protein [Ectothiorhodospiraceae bacterium]|nr:patatin-like phospholipase family protein [Ectothiorhodospiraceae bacterium]